MEGRGKKEGPEVFWHREEKTMTLEGESVLRYALSWPELEGHGLGVRWINRYYVRLARAWRERWRGEIYWRACLDLADSREKSREFDTWSGRLEGEVTLCESGLLSLRFVGEESCGRGKASRVRWGDVWKVKEGVPLRAKELFPDLRSWKKELIARVTERVEAVWSAGGCFLLPDWKEQVVCTLPAEDFCLTSEGMEMAFPQCSIAPAAEGTPIFCVSVGEIPSKQPDPNRNRRFKKRRRKKKNYP